MIDNLETLRVIVDSQRHRIVSALRDGAFTARELSEQLGIPRTRLYYHLGLLERHGVISVAKERIISGIIERTYVASARNFTVDRGLLGKRFSEVEIDDAQASILDEAARDLRARSPEQTSSTEEPPPLIARTFFKIDKRGLAKLRTTLLDFVRQCNDSPHSEDDDLAELAIALFTVDLEVTPGKSPMF